MFRRLVPLAMLAAAFSSAVLPRYQPLAQAQDGLPDLSATLSVSPPNARAGSATTFTLTLRNNGAAATASSFWVELAVNPKSVPTQANQPVESMLSPLNYLAWEVTSAVEAGQSITLSSDASASGILAPNTTYSAWNGTLSAGAERVLVVIDSFSTDGSPNGAVFESDETNNILQQALTGGGPNVTRGGRLFLPLLGVGPGSSAPLPDSRFEAALSYRPKPHGFSFENYGKPDNTANTFSPSDMERLFGRANVCENAAGSDPCILTGPARQWRDQQVAELNGGQCYGMAVASSRFFEGSDSPASFTPGAGTTFDIQKTEQVQNHIAYYFITQSLSPVDNTLGNWIEGKTPAELLDIMREGFKNNQSYVIGFFKREGGGGHAVTPYAIQNMGGNIYRLHVYDNNWPDKERFFEFDLNQNSWRYDFGSTVSGEPVELYDGDARTKNMQIRNLPSHPAGPYVCPFCQGAGVQAGLPVFFEYSGEGRMLLIDPQGRRQGYNAATEQRLREIPGASEQPFLGGLGKDIPPLIELPFDPDATQPYRVVLSGNELEALAFGDLTISAPGLVLGFTDLLLEPTDEMTFTISPDLQELSVVSSSDNALGMFISREPENPALDSVIVEIDEVAIETGETLTMAFDEQQRLTIFSDFDRQVTFDISYTRIDDEPGDEEWVQNAYPVDAGDDFLLDFSQWEDGEAVPVYFDEDGDGFFDDETPGELGDQGQ